MSLLNKMLRDLDSRRAADSERQGLPGDVRPLPTAPRASNTPLIAGVVAVILALAGLFWWAPWVPTVPPALVLPPPPPMSKPPVPVPAVSSPAPAPDAASPAASAPVSAPNESARLKLDAELPGAKGGAKERGRQSGKATASPESMSQPPKRNELVTGGSVNKTPVQGSPMAQAENEYRRGQSLLAQGAAAEGEAALRQALVLTPEHAQARQALFVTMLDQQRKDEARTLLEDGLAILPGHSTWAMNLARLKMEARDPAGAWATLERSLPGALGNGEYRAFCGTVLQRLGRNKEAIEHFNAALRINSAEGRWWLGLALVLEADSHPAEAREAYSRAKASGNLPADLAAFAEQKSRQ